MLAKVLLSIVIVAILVGAIITALFNKHQNVTTSIDPELARAMEYEKVQQGEEAVTVDPEKYPDYENGIYPYVQFDAFFLRDLDNNGEAEGIRGTCNEVGKEDTLYIELKQLTKGYIKEGATITINGEAGKERNFYLETAIVKDNEIKDNCIGNNVNTITLNQIGNGGNGVQKLLTGIVKSGDYTYDSKKTDAIGNNIENYSKENTITFKGTHVITNDDGTQTEVEIEKTVTFNVDWYGQVKTEIPQYINSINNIRQNGDIEKAIDREKNELNLEFTVGVEEVNNQLILKKSYIEGEIPQLSGYNPKKVEITGTNVAYTYNAETREFTAQREAVVNSENNKVTTVANNGIDSSKTERRYNKYTIKVTYDLEAYNLLGQDATIEYRVPVRAYYEGYNNSEGEFKSPRKSNTAQDTFVITFRKTQGEVAKFYVYVGKYFARPVGRYAVSKQKPLRMYNEVSEGEQEDYYTVRWYAVIGTAENQKIVMKETEEGVEGYTSDQFQKTNNSKDSMEDVSSFVGIYFSDPTSMLGENGEIKVYDDETGILLVTFDKDNWRKYTESKPYRYEVPVKHIRIETSNVNKNSSLNVYHIKEIDDEAILSKYTKEQYDGLKQIQSTLAGYLKTTNSETNEDSSITHINTDTDFANYEAPVSVANINVSKTAISTQETEKNYEIKIKAESNEQYNEVKWTNGAFLLKLPKDIIDVEINSVNIDNSDVIITSFEEYEEYILSSDEKTEKYKFIKINTENEKEAGYTITVNCNITPDPRILTTSENIELYAYNENNPNYYYPGTDTYDVNNNLNVAEQVNKRTISISLVSPNSLLTNQVASKYNGENIAVAPQVALVSKEQKSATITMEINNNYTNEISNVIIIGKIPTTGNTYVINGTDMGSNFNATMLGTGIKLPEEWENDAKIYYSEKDDVTKDLTDESNEWKEAGVEEIDFTTVRSFLIDLQDKKLAHGEKREISYEIQLPDDLQYNQVSYSHHAIYFSLETEQGRYRTQTEPNKLGFMIAKQFDLELTKYHLGEDKVVPGATYSVQEVLENSQGEVQDNKQGETKTKVTTSNGKFTLKDLYVERTYIVKEIESPEEYKLNEGEIKFRVKEEEGQLVLENLEEEGQLGETLSKHKKIDIDNENNKVVIETEDEIKANLVITKLEKKQTESPTAVDIIIKGARFKVTGKGMPEEGKIVTTNSEGKVSVKGFELGEEYTLQEIKAEGYYLANQIKFTITCEEGGNYKLNIIQPQEGEEIPIRKDTIAVSVNEDKIPVASFTMEDEKIPRYTLEITKIEKVTDTVVEEVPEKVTKITELEGQTEKTAEGLEPSESKITYIKGAKFKLYKGIQEVGTYETNDSGKIIIENLYAFEQTKGVDQTYRLEETYAPAGYAKVKDITFKVIKTESGLKFEETLEEGQTAKEYEIQENTIKLTVADNPSFKLIKKGEDTEEPIANVKFAIYNIDKEERPATNSKGEIIGEKETINGKEYYILKTNERGEITADLIEGLYKAVELEAPEQYDAENKEYYFGIGSSNEGKPDVKVEWTRELGGRYEDKILSVIGTGDGGYIAGGYFDRENINLGKDINGENATIANNGDFDGLMIKYNSDGKIEWAKGIGGTNKDEITSVSKTSDGGIIAGGCFKSKSVDLGKNIKEENIVVNNNGDNDGLIIKYRSDGRVEWAREVGGVGDDCINSVSGTSDGGILVGGTFSSQSINLRKGANEGDVTLENNGLNDGMIIKYDKEGLVEWAKAVGGTDSDFIESVSETKDGGYIAGGYFFSSSINLEGTKGNIVVNNKSNNVDGLIVKYDKEGKVEWAQEVVGVGDDFINSVSGTSDGGYIVGGHVGKGSINFGVGIDGENIVISNGGDTSGLIIKYRYDGKVEWAKVLEGDSYNDIMLVSETSDGGYIAGGTFNSSSINLGVGKYEETILNNAEEVTVNNSTTGYDDGLIIKYSPDGKVEWAQVVEEAGKTGNNYISSVLEVSNGVIIAGGFFKVLDDLGISVTDYDMRIIKYAQIEKPRIVTKWEKEIGQNSSDEIISAVESQDGGMIVIGEFTGKNVNLGKKENGEDIIFDSLFEENIIIKYTKDEKIQWAKKVSDTPRHFINKAYETQDGGVLVAGGFAFDIDLGIGVDGKRVILKCNNLSGYSSNGMIIKYTKDGIVEWGRVIGGSDGSDEIQSVVETSDGGIIAGGNFGSSSINLGEGTAGEEIIIKNDDYYGGGLIIKYNKDGKVEWTKVVVGDNIRSVIETNDGGMIVGGYFSSTSINLGEGTAGEEIIINKNDDGYSDGLIIKYNKDGKVEWAKAIGGNEEEEIKSVIETQDGGMIVGGYFSSTSINLGEGIDGEDVIVNNTYNYYDNGLIIKYRSDRKIEWVKVVDPNYDVYVGSVSETSDGNVLVAVDNRNSKSKG